MMIVELQARLAGYTDRSGEPGHGRRRRGGGASVPLRGAPATRRGATTRTCFTQFVRESRNLRHTNISYTREHSSLLTNRAKPFSLCKEDDQCTNTSRDYSNCNAIVLCVDEKACDVRRTGRSDHMLDADAVMECGVLLW